MGVLEKKKTFREGFANFVYCLDIFINNVTLTLRRMSVIKNVCCAREGMVLHPVILKQNKYHEYHEGLFLR